ncbi:Ig-like domain-containing protein [Slackia isoflavoniconvertens]|uniref:Ig-like domain-containing protein n=1 Tax=Slackia isoflavoniconvertens TaxID=572010 RepID=UPI003077D258
MADRYSFGHKALSVVLSVVLLGFGWPAVNPSETFASDESAQADQMQAEVAQPEETQTLEETADDSAAMALATADEAAPVVASDEQAVAEPAADESATAPAPSASGEEEASAVEDAVKEDSAVGSQSSSQAAAAQAKTEYDISLVLKNASIKKADGTNELVSLPATKVTVSADKDFKFTVVPDSAYKLNRVLVNVDGQESPLTPDADGVYVVASSDIAKGATLTVEASSALGNVGTVLGGVLGGGAAAASDVSGSADYTISIGKTVTINGSGYGFGDSWESNEESVATVSGRGSSATVTGKGAGTAVITHTYGTFASKEETFTVVVQPATPAQAISISGSDTVTQFSSIQLTATVDPAEATGTYAWSSSNEDILTVDNSGNVTGVRQGTATVTVSFRSAADGSVVSASKDVTVTATEEATDRALVYYLVDPTKDANSNDSGNWGANSLGTARVNTTGATWTGGKNCFDNVDQRVVSWPNGTNVVPRDSDAWNEIFNNYRTTIQAQLPGVTFTKDDVEEIALVPAKISKNNGTNPDMHLDCNVSIKCKNVSLVKYYLRDAGSTQFVQKGAKNYISGNTTEPSDVMNEQFPETKTVDGVTYTFSGWYLDQSFTQPATFPYAVNSSTNFYAKYVGGFQVTYNLAGGSWSNSDATTYIAQEGSTQTVKSEPTREGYKFTGWTIEGLPDTTALKSGDIFAMPAGNVTITANWQELLSYQVKYLEKGTEKQLADPDTRYGEQGDKVSADAKTIDGYHPTDPSHIEKTLESSDNDIIFWYEKDSVEYTVNYYLNDTEQKVADSETKSAPWGTQVKASDLAKDIDGYTAVPNQDATITVDLNGNNSINVYYYQNVSLKANSAEVTYNGKDQSVSGFTGAPEGADFSNITVGAHGTDAGTYDAQFANGTVGTVDKTEKYIVVSAEDSKLVIGKAKVTLKSADLSKKYDGTALENGGTALETESGFAEGEGATYAFTGSQTVVGSSANAFTYVLNEGTKADNYTITKSEGTLTVTNRDAKYEIEVESNSAEFTYDGNEHMVEGFKTLEFTVDGNEYTVSGLSASVSGTDAGTYSNAITGTAKVVDASGNDVTDQFSVATKSGSLVINKAKATIAPKDATKAYDGTDLKASEFVTEGFVKDQGVKSATFTGSQLNVGTSKSGIGGYVLADGTNANNYDITKGTGNLEVTPVSDEVTVTITGNAATLKYDGTEQSVTGYAVACSNGLYTANDFDFTGAAVAKGTNVGTYKMGLDKGQFSNTSANFSNVTFVVEDGWLKIEGGQIDANAITWTTQDVQKVYDGNPLSAFAAHATDKHGNELNVEYSIDGETWTFDPAEISLTHFGSQKVLLRATGSNYAAGQYATSSENIMINKRPVTLTSASANKVYDGTPLTKPEVTVGGDGFVEGEVSGLKAIGTVTNVADGEVDNEIVWDWAEGFGEGNYDITKTEGKLSIEPQSVDPDNPESYTGIKVGELSDLLYKGKDQFQEPTVTDAKGNLLVKDRDYTLAFDGDAKNVTEAGVSVTVSGIGNYKGDFSRSYKILPREVTVESASASKAYDGTPLFSHDVVVTSAAGFVEDDVASMTAPNSITEVGSLTNEIAIEWSNDVAAGNYVVLKEEGVLEVTPKSVTAEGFSVEGLNDVTYNGLAQQQEPTVKDGDKTLMKDKDYTLSFTEDVTNVGTVRVTVTGKGNYTGSADVAYQILPAKLIVTTPSDSMVYNGKPLTAEGSIEGFVNNETAVFETTGSQTEVGESENAYAIYWSDEGTTAKRSNYTVEEHIGTLTVTEYADEIVAVANDVTMTYDGMPHRAEVTVTGVPEGYSVKTAWSGAEATDVTGADGLVANVDEIVVVNAEGKDVTDSLKITKKPGKLVIESKELTVVTMGASKPYDGTPLTANGKIEGFVNGETAAFAVIGSQTEVGECTNAYTIEWSGNAKQGNYTVKEELGKLEVTKSQAAIVIVPKGGKKTYDGTPLVSEGADAYGLPAGFTCEATTKGSVTNVGSAVAEIDTYAIKNADGKDVTDQFGNVSTGFATLLVTKRPVTVVSEDASKVYDGTPLTKHEAGVTEGSMVDGESFVYEFTGIQTVAGESANSFIISAGDGTNLDNYEITKQEGTLKVEPKGIVPGEDNGMKVTRPVDKVYNGKEQKFVPVVTDGEKVLVENVDYVVTYTDALDFEGDAAAKDDFTNVTGDIFVTVTGIGNYAGSLTQSYQITPKPYTVTTVSGSKVYDGTPLEGASLEGNFVGGLVNDDDATFVVTGTQTEVGASDNTYTLEFVDEQMAKNYKLVKEDIGTLTVVKDESEASQNPNGNGESKNKGTLPKTGDMTLATLPFALAVVAGAVLCVAPVARRRSKF